MAETPTDVLVAGYPDIDGRRRASSRWVRSSGTRRSRVILVTQAPDGGVAVRQTCRNLGREGLGRGGGAGLAVGLFAPPLLASVAVEAVAGGVIGEFAGYRVGQDVHGPSDS